MRCTQNPTASEEWRRGWHPERIAPSSTDGMVLVVGAGPAGLEAALAAARRGHDVILSEASEQLGGRVSQESQLPGLAAWARVRDYRNYQLSQLPNVEIYPANELDFSQVIELEPAHVAIATGSQWRRDTYGRTHQFPVTGLDTTRVFTPDDVMNGVKPTGRVLIYDDDHYYMASVIAELLVAEGCEVYFATPAAVVASWSEFTLEQHRIQSRLLELGVHIVCNHRLHQVRPDCIELSCIYSDARQMIEADSIVMVTSRIPNDALYHELAQATDRINEAGIRRLKQIGDCHAPATIAAAVYEGHRFARELGETPRDIPFQREITELSHEFSLP